MVLLQADRMSQEEIEVAEKYHRLIFTFLNVNKLNESDYYGLAAIGYCKAVKKYFRDKELKEKYSFTTIAWARMKTEIQNERQKRRRLKRKADIISLDIAINGEESLSLYNCIGEPDSGIAELPTTETEHEIKGRLEVEQRQQLDNILKGYTIKESAEIMHISKKAAYRNQKTIKEVAAEVLKIGG